MIAREELAEALHYAHRRDDWGVANEHEREEMLDIADALIKAGYVKAGEVKSEYRAVYPAQLQDDSEMEIRTFRDSAHDSAREQAEAVVRYVNKRCQQAGLTIRGRVESRRMFAGEWEEVKHLHNIVRYTDSVTQEKISTCSLCGEDFPWEPLPVYDPVAGICSGDGEANCACPRT